MKIDNFTITFWKVHQDLRILCLCYSVIIFELILLTEEAITYFFLLDMNE